MSRFHTLTVSRVQQETPDAVSVTLDVPNELKNTFGFQPGQYLTLRVMIDGQPINRSYSFCSSPATGEALTIGVKRVPGGKVSTYIYDQLKSGMTLDVMEPMGNFHIPLGQSTGRHFVLIGGGSGITPLLSILKSVLVLEPASRVTLLYGNRNRESVMFYSQLQDLAATSAGRLNIVHVWDDGQTAVKGPMEASVISRLLDDVSAPLTESEYFICGPSPMMKAAEQTLLSHSVPSEKIHIEYFTAKDDADKQAADVGVSVANEPPFTGIAQVTLIYDGQEKQLQVSEKETILNAALDKGYDPPYSCMVAACCTCRAKLIQGKVEMDDRESLTDAEIAKGYVLTCQAHPKSAVITLNFDV